MTFVVPSDARTTVNVVPDTPVTSMISSSINNLNCPTVGNFVADDTVSVVATEEIPEASVVVAAFENCSVAMYVYP
jgi:hypothetical protein